MEGKVLLLFFLPILQVCQSAPSSGCQAARDKAAAAGCERMTMTVSDGYFGGVDREFLLCLPSSYSSSTPAPLILDFHGWSGSAEWHLKDSNWDQVGEEMGLIVVAPDGIPDSDKGIKTWNITKEYSDQWGWRCDPDRTNYYQTECHYSCEEWCNPEYGCTAGTTCYNDQEFIEQLTQYMMDNYCVDTEHVHITGFSNGGTFTYRMFSFSSMAFGAFGAVSGSPFIGSGVVPQPPRVRHSVGNTFKSNGSMIDFHGLEDGTVPQQYEFGYGEGPMGEVRTILSGDALYYLLKPDFLDLVADTYNCADWVEYPTEMDGESDWRCQLRSGCDGNAEIVKCTGLYSHSYPFSNHGPNALVSAKILWNFFKDHPATL